MHPGQDKKPRNILFIGIFGLPGGIRPAGTGAKARDAFGSSVKSQNNDFKESSSDRLLICLSAFS